MRWCSPDTWNGGLPGPPFGPRDDRAWRPRGSGVRRHCRRRGSRPSGNPIWAPQAPETDGETPGWLEELRLYTSAYATPRSKTVRQLVIGVVLIIPVVVLGIFRPALYASAVLVGLAASTVIAVGLSSSILAYIGRLRSRAFGFVPGTTPNGSATFLMSWPACPDRPLRSPWCPG